MDPPPETRDILAHAHAQAGRDLAAPFSPEEPLFHVVLVQPEIPQNTGNIGRLCVGMGARLHLVGPFGFQLDEKARRRAGLDYWENLDWERYTGVEDFLERFEVPRERRFVLTKWAKETIWEVSFQRGDALLFGSETAGLPSNFAESAAGRPLAIPRLGPVRSYNLANSVGIAGFELLRQIGI